MCAWYMAPCASGPWTSVRPAVPPEERLAVGSAVEMVRRRFTANALPHGDFNPNDRGIRNIPRSRPIGASLS